MNAVYDAFWMDGTRVWVTGASRGLGRAIAEGLLDGGASVAVTARSSAPLEEIRSSRGVHGDSILCLPGSVDDESAMQAAVAAIDATFGGLDVLVNCAGISPSMTPSSSVSLGEWQEVLSVNLTGTLVCSRAASQLMLRDGGGSIVNVSSIHGVSGMPRLAAYSASKGGLEALTRTLSAEWAKHSIRVNALAPGYFATELTEGLREDARWRDRLLERIPLGRFGEPEELVPAVVFLASDASRYVTGTTLYVDGGWTAQ